MYKVFKTTVGDRGVYYGLSGTIMDPNQFNQYLLGRVLAPHDIASGRRISLAVLATDPSQVSTVEVGAFEEREQAGTYKSGLILASRKAECLNVQLYVGGEESKDSPGTRKLTIWQHISIPGLDPIDILQIGHKYYIRPEAVDKYDDLDAFVSEISFYKQGEWYEFFDSIVIDNYIPLES